ncbi:adenylosuccinate lyase [Candidatus Saccharibacteria bacterium]|nr:adenylosuccinate lyase [Candidatus Saccharibacteria bacterium]
MGIQEQLLAVTPIDGRYANRVESLSPIVSEYGLIQRRVAVEAAWLDVLGSGVLPDMDPLSDAARDQLKEVVTDFRVNDAIEVKDIEKTTNHDVKAVEMWLRQKLSGDPELEKYLEFIHFGCTSEDISNLAYAMMVRDAKKLVIEPGINNVLEDLGDKSLAFANLPMLAHTHGQPATPTTLGKEMAVFYERIDRSKGRLGSIAILGKFNGATGNYNSVSVAYPEVDWPAVSQRFVESLGFEFNTTTTQIEPHDWLVALCNELGLNNQIMTDLSRDMWTYISMGYFKQQVKAGEVGSSTMPHKVNPIDFENAESNFGSANAILGNLAAKLPISRLQRDLSDSSTQRTIGEAFGHTVVAHSSLKRGLKKVDPNKDKIAEDLDSQWAVLTEAVQTVMRRYGVEGAYGIIKNASRGQEMTEADYQNLVNCLDIPDEAKATLQSLRPSTYIGRAPEIAKR